MEEENKNEEVVEPKIEQPEVLETQTIEPVQPEAVEVQTVETAQQQIQEIPQVEELTPTPTRNNKKGGNKIIIIIIGVIIIIIAIVLLLLGGKDKNSNNENKENNSNNENTEQKENKENTEKPENTETDPIPNTTETEIIELEFAQIPCGTVDFTIGKGTVEVGNISTHDKLGMLSTALLKLVTDEEFKNLSPENDLELNFNIIEEAKKYFDVDEEMKKQIEDGFGTGFYLFSHKNNKSTLKIIAGRCTGPLNQGYYIKTKDSKEENNILIKSYYYYYIIYSGEPVVIGKENGYDITDFASTYYKEKGDSTPIYKDVLSNEEINYDLFNTLDVYYDLTNGNMKLTKVVFNTK